MNALRLQQRLDNDSTSLANADSQDSQMFVCVPNVQQSWKAKSQNPYDNGGVVTVVRPEERLLEDDTVDVVLVDSTPGAAVSFTIS